MPATGSSMPARRTASRSWRLLRPPGSGVPVPGAMPGSTTSTSTDKNTASQSSVATVERLVEAVVESPVDDLGHVVAAHAPLGHPGQRRRLRPVPAQADLDETVTARRPRLDEPPHRCSVTEQRAELGVPGVGVGIEMDDRDPAPAHVPGDPRHVGEGDRVVAAEDDGDRTRACDLLDGPFEALERLLGLPRQHLHVAHIDDAQLDEGVDVQCQVRPARRRGGGSRSGGSPGGRSDSRGGARCPRRRGHR